MGEWRSPPEKFWIKAPVLRRVRPAFVAALAFVCGVSCRIEVFKSMVEGIVLQFFIDAETGAEKNGQTGNGAEVVVFYRLSCPSRDRVPARAIFVAEQGVNRKKPSFSF